MATNLDLNLLPILEMLVRERNVTRAARRLGLSQPTVSRALAELRHQLGDELMIRTRVGMEPTPRALLLVAPLSRALEDIHRALDLRVAFTPSSTTTTFTLSMGDYETLILLPDIYARFAVEAPQARLSVQTFRRPVVEEALNSGTVQLAIGRVVGPAAHLHQLALFEDKFVLTMRRGHPLEQKKQSLKNFVSVPHILISAGGGGDFRGLIDDQLDAVREARTVTLSVPHFLAAPHLVAASDSIMAMPSRLAERYAQLLPITVLPLPFKDDGFEITMTWHNRTDSDPAWRWFRGLVEEISASISSGHRPADARARKRPPRHGTQRRRPNPAARG